MPLARLAFLWVMLLGFGPCSAVVDGMTSPLSLWEHRDSRDRMNLHPLCMETVLDQSANYLDVRTHRRQRHLIGVVGTRRFGVLLSNRKSAYNLENQIPSFIADVPGVQ